MSIIALCVLLQGLVIAFHGVAATTNQVNFCFLAEYHPSSTSSHFHGRFSVTRYASDYAGVNFTWTAYAKDGNQNFTTAIASLLSMPKSCSFLVGPTTSRFSVAVSPLVTMPWFSASATSTSLSDKQTHKWFSRVIPNDLAGGAGLAALVAHYSWRSVHVICSDESYGVSLLAGFSNEFTTRGSIVSSTCFAPSGSADADREEWVGALQRIQSSSNVRIVVVAHVDPGDVMVDAIVSLGMHRTHVFVFGENCDSVTPNVTLKLRGAMCASYYVANYAAFEQAYAARNVTQDSVDAVALGLASTNVTDSSMYGLMTVDLVRHVMGAAHAAYVANGSTLTVDASTFPTLMTAARSHVSSGFSGTVELNSRGDREEARVAFVNIQPRGKVTFATWTAANGTEMIDGGPQYWLDEGFMDPPTAIVASASSIPVVIVIAALCASIVLLLLVLMFFKLRSASPEVYAQLIRSGIAITVGKIIAHSVDIGTDVISCVVVVTRDVGSSTFVIIYVCLTVIAVAASVAELVVLVLQFADTLHHHGDLSVAQEVEWERRLARTAVISLIAEDLPMAVIATVAIREQADIPLLVSLLLSTILFGTKATFIPPLVQSIMRSKAVKRSGMDSATIGSQLHSATPSIVLDAAAAEIQANNPDRYEQLRQHAVDAVVLCREQQIDQNEFFAGVWQRTAILYETGGSTLEESKAPPDP